MLSRPNSFQVTQMYARAAVPLQHAETFKEGESAFSPASEFTAPFPKLKSQKSKPLQAQNGNLFWLPRPISKKRSTPKRKSLPTLPPSNLKEKVSNVKQKLRRSPGKIFSRIFLNRLTHKNLLHSLTLNLLESLWKRETSPQMEFRCRFPQKMKKLPNKIPSCP